MKRKNKVRLVTVGGVIFLCSFFPSVFYFFPDAVLKISIINVIFVIPCFLFVLWPAKHFKIAAQLKQPKYSYFKWLGLIFLTQLCIISVFILQNKLFFDLFKNYFEGMNALHFFNGILLPNLGWNFGFFPWTILAAVSAFFAYSSVQYNTSLPFSSYLLPKKKMFFLNEVRRIMDIFIQLNTRLFVIIILSLFSLWIVSLAHPAVSLLTALNAIMMGGVLLLSSQSKWFGLLITKMERKRVRQGIPLAAKFLLFMVIAWIVLFIYHAAFLNGMSPFIRAERPLLILKNSPIFLKIWNIGFWLMGLPLLGSLLIAFSHGRSVRQFILHVLFFPAVLLGIYAIYPDQVVSMIFSNGGLFFMTVFAAIGLAGFLFAKDLEVYLWLGYLPMKKSWKRRRVSIEQLFSFALGILTLTLFINVLCPVLFFAIFGMGNFFIFLSFLLLIFIPRTVTI